MCASCDFITRTPRTPILLLQTSKSLPPAACVIQMMTVFGRNSAVTLLVFSFQTDVNPRPRPRNRPRRDDFYQVLLACIILWMVNGNQVFTV
jgi:hypothetical protein